MNEAMVAVLKLADEVIKLQFIEALTHPENVGSIQLLNNNDFIYNPMPLAEGNENNIVFTRKGSLN